MPTRKKGRVSAGRLLEMLALAVLLAVTLPFAFRQAFGRKATPNPLRVTFLDVGKGDAAVIETPSGKVIVVDTGGSLGQDDDQGKRTIIPYLQRRGIRQIDALLLTHPHPDHIGGAVSLIERFPVKLLLDNDTQTDTPPVRRYREAAQTRGVPYHPARRGLNITYDAVRIHVLAPARTLAQGRVNNTSVVLRVEYGSTAFLLTGDAEAESETEMRHSGETLSCDVLKVGHHGSSTATTSDFLDAASPRFAVISVNANNRNGYPHTEVLQRLQERGIVVCRTDQNGSIIFLSDGVTVRTAREKMRNYASPDL